ncbi:peptidoglycan DD-metalloendopeptidase family protein [Pseudomonas lalucatii]|uniref:Peptidoglycan DD-metalloendopeptidase family protein n=1 Tax=Pseudomonas lalucatii TaxID=1424203 RepID=A0ABS5Q4W6_9PSED|nr:M23 family metallopeptidase [Pseudomonas lalucatii]MBS7663801.1 peptidoglycan DD-metalloendopeptidase family protein [Pseudomonas lalucatii]MBS7689673.1 peptidoglycan DD-metalloendopeptidase family protein [Pseudomonas lalucatii]MBS7725221.1 peptidoglycan DD-metalloendopeptidase family protein [Pseudomonas lalucatii]
MQIILLSRRHGAARSLSLDLHWLLMALAVLVVAALGSGVAVGAWWAPQAPRLQDSAQITEALDRQRAEVGAVRVDAQRQLDAFAAHVAELQARLTRLDALGERLTELAELDSSEFDFSLDVGQGGPEEILGGAAYAPPPFISTLDDLALRLDSREQQLEVLEQLLAERRLDEAEYLAGRPVLQGYISSPFGRRTDPLSGRLSMHKGVDFAAKAGSDVVAVAAGVVTASGRRSGYGNTVEISHADGYVTLYAHNRSNLVQVGDLVQRGQTIAKVGSTGRSTGYHVHFEVSKNGRVINPASFIARVSGVE